MKISHSSARLGLAAGLLGGTAGLALAAGFGPGPTMFELASDDQGPGDISGPCDEAEHAGDPSCVAVDVPGVGTGTTVPTTNPTTSMTPTTPTTTPGGDPSSVHSLDAAGAGAVVYAVEGGSLRLVTAMPATGWEVEVEQAVGREIEVDFRSGTRRVQVNVELEDGGPRERVRVRDDADGTDVRTDDGVRDDRSDDNSGSGHGSDDDQSDDDQSDDDQSDDDQSDDDQSDDDQSDDDQSDDDQSDDDQSDDDQSDNNSGSGHGEDHGGDDDRSDDNSGSGHGEDHGGDDDRSGDD